jgi:hypothetical protein
MKPARHPFLHALEPVADALGAELVNAKQLRPGDVPLVWEGAVVGGLRLPLRMHGTLDHMMATVEHEIGVPLGDMSREQKQQAVRTLEARGAFDFRRSVETVADAMGVSRFTIYNYLNASGRDRPT